MAHVKTAQASTSDFVSLLSPKSHCSTTHPIPSHGPCCSARALRPSSPKLFFIRLTRLTVLLTRKASARACRVGTTHMTKWIADLWAFHCSCLFCIVNWQFRVSGANMHKGQANTVDMSPAGLMSPSSQFTIEHICMKICFHLVSAVCPKVIHNVKTFSNFISHRKIGYGSKGSCGPKTR